MNLGATEKIYIQKSLKYTICLAFCKLLNRVILSQFWIVKENIKDAFQNKSAIIEKLTIGL